MTSPISAEQMLTAFKADVSDHPNGMRWAHTHGVGIVGQFVASAVARDYCIADHWQGHPTPVTVRLSNGSSEAQRHDEYPDTRGMAVKFHHRDGTESDLLAMTLPVFGAKTREEFLEVSQAFVPRPVTPTSWFRAKILDPLLLQQAPPALPPGVTLSGGPGLAVYAGSHQFARAFVLDAGQSQVPVSWARTAYHAVHTFVIVGPDGLRRFVRFSWQPVDGVFPVPPNDMADLAPDFLTTEMRARLAHAPARFTLRMTIGEVGDAVDDPTQEWPVTRRSVQVGMLYLERMASERGIDVESLSYNPMRLPAGIEPSADAILHARGEIYQLGCRERGGQGCPFHAARSNPS